MVEKGRRCRPPQPRQERLCPTCGLLGDEIHFLVDCNVFRAQRQEAYGEIIKITPNFRNITDSKQKFTFLLSQENITIIKITAKCNYMSGLKYSMTHKNRESNNMW